MALLAGVGHAHALDGREATMQATYQALSQMGSSSVALGLVIAPHRYDPQQIYFGISSLTGSAPVLGFSTTGTLTAAGYQQHGVVVALLGSEDLDIQTHWLPGYAQASGEAAEQLLRELNVERNPVEAVLAIADGFNGDAEQFCSAIPAGIPLFGALAGGDPTSGYSYQICGSQNGTSSMAAAFIRGKVRVSVGHGHGWSPIGSRFRVTRSRGYWLRTLDGHPASESYARLFGYPARDWAFPPLNQMVRLYPLGIERGADQELLIRSPLRVEADGSLRMNCTIRDGSDAYLLIGNPDSCIAAARQAAQQALAGLGGSTPRLVLVLVDSAWQMVMQSRPGEEVRAIRDVFGSGVPIGGGYTLGQIAPAAMPDSQPAFLNQQVVVVAFGQSD